MFRLTIRAMNVRIESQIAYHRKLGLIFIGILGHHHLDQLAIFAVIVISKPICTRVFELVISFPSKGRGSNSVETTEACGAFGRGKLVNTIVEVFPVKLHAIVHLEVIYGIFVPMLPFKREYLWFIFMLVDNDNNRLVVVVFSIATVSIIIIPFLIVTSVIVVTFPFSVFFGCR